MITCTIPMCSTILTRHSAPDGVALPCVLCAEVADFTLVLRESEGAASQHINVLFNYTNTLENCARITTS